MIYIFIFLLLLFLSFRYDICGRKRGRDFWYYTIMVLLILIAGLRWRVGTDTIGYLDSFYYKVPKIDHIDFNYLDIKYPLWRLLNSIVYTVFGKFYVLQLIEASFVLFLVFKYIKKHSFYLFTSILLFYIWMYISITMETMKAGMSIAVCLFANDYLVEKKLVKGSLLYLVGCLFHFSTWLLFLVVPIIIHLKFDKVQIRTLLIFFLLGFVFKSVVGDNIALLDFDDSIYEKAEQYRQSDRLTGGMGIFSSLLQVIPILLYSMISLEYLKKNKCKVRYEKMGPLITIGIIFLVLQMNVYIFYRYAHFFSVYIIIIISNAAIIYLKKARHEQGVLLRYILILAPLIIVLSLNRVKTYYRYYPYYSIIERKVDEKREMKQSEYHQYRDIPRKNNY